MSQEIGFSLGLVFFPKYDEQYVLGNSCELVSCGSFSLDHLVDYLKSVFLFTELWR